MVVKECIKKPQTLLRKRNERIRERFRILTEQKRYAIDYALELLSDEFLPLTPNTIWLIVSQTGYYKNS